MKVSHQHEIVDHTVNLDIYLQLRIFQKCFRTNQEIKININIFQLFSINVSILLYKSY